MRSLVLSLFCWVFATSAMADVSISRLMNEPIYSGKDFAIKTNSFSTQLLTLQRSGTVSVTTQFNGSNLTVLICNEANYRRFQNNQAWRCWAAQNQPSPIALSATIHTSGNYYVVWDNSKTGLTTQTARVWLDAPGYMNDRIYRFIKQRMDYFDDLIGYTFVTGPVSLTVKPCGYLNAFASLGDGSITMCTELFEYALKNDNMGVIYQTFFHELGHSLLARLRLPGADDESLVDEFSVYMMFQTRTHALLPKAMEYWLDRDSHSEAQAVLTRSTPHPVSVQRARNMMNVVQNMEWKSQTWNNLIYPNLTTHALRDAQKTPSPVDSPKLAARILQTRN